MAFHFLFTDVTRFFLVGDHWTRPKCTAKIKKNYKLRLLFDFRHKFKFLDLILFLSFKKKNFLQNIIITEQKQQNGIPKHQNRLKFDHSEKMFNFPEFYRVFLIRWFGQTFAISCHWFRFRGEENGGNYKWFSLAAALFQLISKS